MSKLVNAGIKNRKELLKRLIDGETFVSASGTKVQYDNKSVYPFRYGHLDLFSSDAPSPTLLCKEVEWYNAIPKGGVICWVSDTLGEAKALAVISAYYENNDTYKFETIKGSYWVYAEPVKASELLQED